MGWTGMYSLGGCKTPKAYLDKMLTYDTSTHESTVLLSAQVHFTEYYAAVQHLELATGTTRVFAVICMMRYNPRAADREIFGYKDMSESCGPNQVNCPLDILNLLTPTDSKYAVEWRQACRDKKRARAGKPKLVAGKFLVLPMALNFGGTELSRFEIRERTLYGRKRITLYAPGGLQGYRIRNLKNYDYRIEEAA